MKKQLKIYIALLFLIIVVLVALILFFNNKPLIKTNNITIITDKIEYTHKETIKLSIINNLADDFCLWSCETYVFEKKGEDRVPIKCIINEIIDCIKPGRTKIIKIPTPEEGIYRIRIEDIYSNEFVIK